MKHLTIPPTLDSMERLTAFIDETLVEANVPAKTITRIHIATDEVFANIIMYSHASQARIDCEVKGGEVTLRFIDDGIPYDPAERPDPDVTLSADDREIGGLGIYLIKKSMDSIEYEYADGKNILTIRKKF